MSRLVDRPRADAEAAWKLVGDSDFLNRMAANPPLDYNIHPEEGGFPELRGVIYGPGPIRHHFREVDLYWVHGQRFRQIREIQGPLLQRAHYEATLTPDGDGVRTDLHFELSPAYRLVSLPVRMVQERNLARWNQLLQELPAPGQIQRGPALRQLSDGVKSALRRWQERGAPERVATAVTALFEQARPWELQELRPSVLAQKWMMNPRELLVSFLEGTQAGVFELYWSVRCPRCQGGVSMGRSLSNLADHADCSSCRIEFQTDLETTVEILFAAPPELRTGTEQAFCTLYPAGRPEVLAMMILQPGAEERFSLELPAGSCKLGIGGAQPDQLLEVGEEGEERWQWSSVEAPPTAMLKAGKVEFTLQNPSKDRVRVDLALRRNRPQGTSAALLATMPEYRERFGPQVLAPDIRISVQAVAILFTDLTGSAALYHEQGDASAFRFVHEHFAILARAVTDNGGVSVKTIGDALMAAFHQPDQAVQAGLQMLKDFDAWVGSWAMNKRPGLKVGIHYGPAMAVHTDNAGLDYFGGTVNLAARAQGKAGGGDMVWTESVQNEQSVQNLLKATGLSVRSFEAPVKPPRRPPPGGIEAGHEKSESTPAGGVLHSRRRGLGPP
jgi:class 3 adenylate cyclase